MLKEIAQAWRNGGLMRDVVNELAQMIADAEYVFTHAWEVWSGQAVADATEKPLRERDKSVNRQEREIRRMLVEHLAINPSRDASGCLAIMTMAKDAERIGDLAKDIFKLSGRLGKRGSELDDFDRLDIVARNLGTNLPRLQRAIRESDEDVAREIFDTYEEIKEQCRGLFDDAFESELPSRESTCKALLIHYLSRINAHIGNATSGVVFSVENIDFVSRGLREQKRSGKK